MPYTTNIVVEGHNAWTLGKHLAISANKAAAKIDAKVYGTHTNIVVRAQPEPVVTHNNGVKDFFMGLGCFILLVVLFVGVVSGKLKWWQCLP